jgi:hypothetical protein
LSLQKPSDWHVFVELRNISYPSKQVIVITEPYVKLPELTLPFAGVGSPQSSNNNKETISVEKILILKHYI